MTRMVFFAFIIIIFLPILYFCYAQEKNVITVKEYGFDIAVGNIAYKFYEEQKNQFKIRDYYDYTDESAGGYFKLPSRNIIVAIPPESKIHSSLASFKEANYSNIIPSLNPIVELVNDSTIDVKEVDYSDRKSTGLSQQLIENKGYFWFRDFYCVHLKINTHRYDEMSSTITEISNIVLKIEIDKKSTLLSYSPVVIKSSFDENVMKLLANSDIAEQFRGRPKLLLNDSTGNWINYSANYLKIGTGSDGLFRIPKSYFDSYGISTTGINPKTFQLFESGIEKPIYVFGENDLTFDNGDYIEFYGTKNYSKISARVINANNMPYNNYLDKYTDTTMYFLTWGTQNGKRAEEINVFQPSVTDSLTYYTSFTHSEENPMDALFYTFSSDLVSDQFPFWETSKGWYWNWVATWSQPIVNISTSDMVPNNTAKFYAKLASRGSTGSSNVHLLKLLLNNSVIDSQVTDRYERVLLNGSVNTNSLLEGNNTIKISYAENNGGTNGQLLLDWVELEYPKKLKLVDESLYFEYRDLTSTSVKTLKIANVSSSNLVLYKVKPVLKRITAYTVSGSDLVFTDTVNNGDAYYLKVNQNFLEPKFYIYKSFINLRNQNSQADYIAITHPVFQSSVTNYLNFISSGYSVTTNLTSVNAIYDEFGYGYPTPESIRDFLKVKFQNISEPKPSYLVLFGDANYDYKKYRTTSQGVIGGGNFVPSFGYPVSDQYYTVWDDTTRLPNMYVGRLPLNKTSEMDYYKSKVQNNLNNPYDDWNKKYLFFSGGRANLPEEVDLYKSVNDSVINNFIIPPPLCGVYKHFYKTTNPITDFGPYSESEINKAIAGGGVFISYIGHSGTATWDNSISDVRQLKNSVNRNPVISDFGCSTNKFAEPDIVAFGERFVLDKDGEALGYIGNSALGFVSTAIKGPGNFYKHVIQDTMFEIGKAHWNAKLLMYDFLGNSSVVKQFALSNALIGDPIVRMKIPNRPNLTIRASDISFGANFINDAIDSVEVVLSLNNFGTVTPQSFKLLFNHSFGGMVINQIDSVRQLPKFKDTLSFWVRVKEKPGQHTLLIKLDIEDSISEIYENDNNLSIQFDVASTFIRDILVDRINNPLLDSLMILSPSINNGSTSPLNLQLANNENFINPIQSSFVLDTFYTKINFNAPANNDRTWLRFRLGNETIWSNPLSFSRFSGSKFFVGDEYSWKRQNMQNLRVVNNSVELNIDSINISIISAGGYSGQYCVITRNGINILSNTFFQGIGVVVLDEKTFAVDSSAWFELFNNVAGANAFSQFVEAIPSNKLVALGVSGDAMNNIWPNVISAVVSLGGTRFPSLQFKAPYALFGKKGADSTQVKQVIRNSNEPPIFLDTNLVVPFTEGVLTSSLIGPSSEWNKLKVAQNIINDSQIKFRPIGIRKNGTDSTFSYLPFSNNESDLSFIPAEDFPQIKIVGEFKADTFQNSPKLSKLEVDYKGIAELGTNYQAVKVNKDTLEQGETGKVSFSIYNVGEAQANNLKVEVGVMKPDNSYQKIFNTNITLAPLQKQKLESDYITTFESGSRTFKITIDPDNLVAEHYEDNNVFLYPFYIKRDTTTPALAVAFDGKEVVDGDYVSPNPTIRMELTDISNLPIADTSVISIQLDNTPIFFAQNPSILTYVFNPSNPKMVVEYKPKLNEGEHTLKVFANDGFGNLADSAGLEKRFIVSNEMKMLDIYNYPNPIKSNTHFTFTVTQVPDKIKILVYSVAGRLVKEITRSKNELTSNFNKIFWDTRDEDGDLLGNGTYFYKVIMEAGDKTESSTHKMAIVR